MPRAKSDTTRPKSTAEYRLTVTATSGEELYSVGGPLSRCLSLMGDSVFAFGPWVELDSYHKVRRELVASGGGYAKYYPANGSGLLLVNIVDCALLPAPVVDNTPLAPRPVDTSLAPEVVYQHPDFYSGFASGAAAAPGVPVQLSPDCAEIICEGCGGGFYAHSILSPRYCVDCMPAAPSPSG